MQERYPLRKQDIIRDKEDYSISDMVYFAQDIIVKDDEVSKVYGPKPTRRIEWYTQGEPVELYATDLDKVNAFFQLTINDPSEVNGKRKYVFSGIDTKSEYMSASRTDGGNPMDTTTAENTETVMEYLRTHPSVDEPLMNEIGRSRLRYIEKVLALVAGTDPQLPRPATDQE